MGGVGEEFASANSVGFICYAQGAQEDLRPSPLVNHPDPKREGDALARLILPFGIPSWGADLSLSFIAARARPARLQ